MMEDKITVLVDESAAPLDGSDVGNDEVRICNPFDPSQVRVETKNTQMDALIKRIRNDEIDLFPNFQRRSGIWDEGTQSRLIESMLIKIPLPAFYMDATDDNKWLVVDGLQRLTTISRYVIKQEFGLKELEFLTDYNGKKFSDLPRSFQRRIEETDIVLYQIQPGTPPDVKFDIFRRINTGGEPLSPQEIRHALNQGKIVNFLAELAGSREFLLATDKGVSPKRMDDRECVLRFLAFTFSSARKYDKDNFDLFLNEAMVHGNSLDQSALENYRILFLKSMTTSYRIFGKDAFRKRYKVDSARYPINKALFESISVNIGQLSDTERFLLIERRDRVKETMIKLLNEDHDFESSISQGTGSIKKVWCRFTVIENLLREVLK